MYISGLEFIKIAFVISLLFFPDSEISGFLKIESVSTLDPAAASQMFGDG